MTMVITRVDPWTIFLGVSRPTAAPNSAGRLVRDAGRA